MIVHSFDPPERFVVGTVGEPGQRTFFLQARAQGSLVSVALEKQQVVILSERVGELLDEVLQAGETDEVVPAVTPAVMVDNGPLDQPIEEEFRAGTITLSWDAQTERVVIEVFPISEEVSEVENPEDYEEPEPTELFVVRLPSAMARAFCSRAESVVEAGREQCPFCGGPIDPSGHLCPRANGFRRTLG